MIFIPKNKRNKENTIDFYFYFVMKNTKKNVENTKFRGKKTVFKEHRPDWFMFMKIVLKNGF